MSIIPGDQIAKAVIGTAFIVLSWGSKSIVELQKDSVGVETRLESIEQTHEASMKHIDDKLDLIAQFLTRETKHRDK